MVGRFLADSHTVSRAFFVASINPLGTWIDASTKTSDAPKEAAVIIVLVSESYNLIAFPICLPLTSLIATRCCSLHVAKGDIC